MNHKYNKTPKKFDISSFFPFKSNQSSSCSLQSSSFWFAQSSGSCLKQDISCWRRRMNEQQLTTTSQTTIIPLKSPKHKQTFSHSPKYYLGKWNAFPNIEVWLSFHNSKMMFMMVVVETFIITMTTHNNNNEKHTDKKITKKNKHSLFAANNKLFSLWSNGVQLDPNLRKFCGINHPERRTAKQHAHYTTPHRAHQLHRPCRQRREYKHHQYIDCELWQRLELTWSVGTGLAVTISLRTHCTQITPLRTERISSTDPAVNAESINTINT